MRVASSSIVNLGVYDLQLQQNALLQTQQQISTGRRIVTPADDPVGASRVIELQQADSMNTQYTANRTAAENNLNITETTLHSVTDLITSMQTSVVAANSGALNATDRATLAATLAGNLADLIGLANSTDGAGTYLFAGSKGATQPFANTAAGVQYNGDQGQQQVQIASGRQLPISASGAATFMAIRNGNGTFATAAAAANTGTGVIDSGTVTDPTKWNAATNPKNISLKFAVNTTVTPNVTTYDIIDNTTGKSMITNLPSAPGPGPAYPNTFTSGQTISLSGLNAAYGTDLGAQVTITGSPANNDTFTLTPSANQSLFATVQNVINALQAAPGPGGVAAYQNALVQANTNLGNALNNVLTVRASVGTQLQEVTASQFVGDALSIQYKQTISLLQDTNMTQAISQLNQQQTTYTAALKAFQSVQGLSLFNYM